MENLQQKLVLITEASKAKFGKMTPQHMVEHLTLTVKIAYKIKWPEYEISEKHLTQKEMLLNTAMDFPRGLKAPGSNGELMPLKYSGLQEAKEHFLRSIQEYHNFFKARPEVKTLHPRLSWLTYTEWEKFHAKHFMHHLGQFGVYG